MRRIATAITVWLVLCMPCEALDFDNVNDSASFTPVSLGTTNSATIWLYWRDTVDGVVIGRESGNAHNAGYMFYIDSTNIYYNASQLNSVNFVSVGRGGLTINNWHHLAVTRNGTSVSFWLNGVQLGSTQTLSANNTQGDIGSVGAYGASTTSRFFSNMIGSDVAIFARTLNAPEVAVKRFGANQVQGATRQWMMIESAGSNLTHHDISGNSGNATGTGGAAGTTNGPPATWHTFGGG